MDIHFTPPTYETTAGPRTGRNTFGVGLRFYTRALFEVIRTNREIAAGKMTQELFVTRCNNVARIIESCGGAFRVEGLNFVAKTPAPVVFAANHMSTLETFLLPGMIVPFMPLTFVVKKQLVTYPVFGGVLKFLDPIAVGRDNPREDLKTVLTGGAEALASGRSVCIFPQTTRRTTFVPAQFNTLAEKLAARAKVPIVPLALRTDFWSNGRVIKDFGPIDATRGIKFAFGPPMAVDARTQKQVHAEVVDFISRHLTEWGVPVETDET